MLSPRLANQLAFVLKETFRFGPSQKQPQPMSWPLRKMSVGVYADSIFKMTQAKILQEGDTFTLLDAGGITMASAHTHVLTDFLIFLDRTS